MSNTYHLYFTYDNREWRVDANCDTKALTIRTVDNMYYVSVNLKLIDGIEENISNEPIHEYYTLTFEHLPNTEELIELIETSREMAVFK